MGLTVADTDARPARRLSGGLGERIVKVTFDSSYATGGEALSAGDVGLTSILFVDAHPASGYVFEYDYTNSKLLVYYADNDAGADGALIQVPNTTNLSTLVTRAFVIGVL